MSTQDMCRKIEKEIRLAISKHLKNCTGRGPMNVGIFWEKEFLLIKIEGYLLPAEIKTSESEQGYYDVKFNRYKWAVAHRQEYLDIVEEIIGKRVVNSYYDADPITNSGVVVFWLGNDEM